MRLTRGTGSGRRFLLLGGAALLILFAAWASLSPPPNPRTPSGLRRFSSSYATMPDGSRLAVRLALPPGYEKGARIPALMEVTRYGTKSRPTALLNALLNLRIAKLRSEGPLESAFAARGYAVVRVDARGSGASFGRRDMEFSREEIGDLGSLVDWIVSQPWSNGQVGTYGLSFSGNSAELALACRRPALLGAAPLYPDFDPVMENALPGGLFNVALVRAWNEANQAMDKNRDHGIFFTGPQPVDGDRGGRLLGAAIAGHRSFDSYEALNKLRYTDQELAPGYLPADLAPWSRRADIEALGRPLYLRVGWLDAATTKGALERYLSYSNPQTLVIGPWGHGGRSARDPFLDIGKPREELEALQGRETADFFQALFEGRAPGGKSILYYTFGEGSWKRSEVWPPEGLGVRRLWLDAGRALSATPPREAGRDRYRVDFGTSTGERNRWRTNLGGGPVVYPDRAAEDIRLLCYTSPPLERDLEITGSPLVTLSLSSSASDGALFVYLEDLGPDGKVSYITEGELRLLYRAESKEGAPHAILGPWHSGREAEASPLVPEETVSLRLALEPTSVLLRKGHSIRLAIAGQDAASFAPLPAEGQVELALLRGGDGGSWLELPSRER